MSNFLLADDDATFRAVTRRQLTQLGFTVVEDESGTRVLSLIREHHPVACLIDLVMEGKEGVETIMEISRLPQPPKVIAVSSNKTYLEMMRHLGANAVLQKPISSDELRSTLVSLGVLKS